jgi:hypothetical protein
MKQETVDVAIRSGILAMGTGTAWTLQDFSHLAAIIAAMCTAGYALVSLFFVIRKWYRLEKSGWRSHDTDHSPLDERKRRGRE